MSTSDPLGFFISFCFFSLQMDQSCLCSAVYGHMDSQAVEALDLPGPTCFRSRSHSYLRAIQAGCSQDDDDSDSDDPPLISGSNTSSESHNFILLMYTALSKRLGHMYRNAVEQRWLTNECKCNVFYITKH